MQITDVSLKWESLVSDTNWQKGDLLASLDHFNGESFARAVGGTTPDQLSRLRDVAIRFPAEVRNQFANLRWSHFLAALNWPDADEWLQSAANANLTVAQMRMRRFEKLG